jgi:hypothetical protein
MIDLIECRCGAMHDARTALCDDCSFREWISDMEKRRKKIDKFKRRKRRFRRVMHRKK